MDTSSTSDAIDLLTTSDNRIGLLLAEVSFSIMIFAHIHYLMYDVDWFI